MTEVVSGLQTSLGNILSGNFTYKGKPLKFEEVEDSNGQVYQAKTNLTDEELALGNNDNIITFSLEQAVGNIVVTRVPIEDKEREEIAKSVNDKKAKLKEGETYEAKEMNRADEMLSGSTKKSKQKQPGTQTADEDPLNKENVSGGTTASTSTKSDKWGSERLKG